MAGGVHWNVESVGIEGRLVKQVFGESKIATL